MIMNAVMCVPRTRLQADRILDTLHAAHFPCSHVSLVFPKPNSLRVTPTTGGADSNTGFPAKDSQDGVIGSALHWLEGVGMLSLPGLRPVLVAGPLLTLLRVHARMGSLRPLVSSFIGLGASSAEAERVEQSIGSGAFLVSVHSNAPAERQSALDVFAASGAAHIYPSRCGAEASASRFTTAFPTVFRQAAYSTPRRQPQPRDDSMSTCLIGSFDSIFWAESFENLAEYRAKWRRKARNMVEGRFVEPGTPDNAPSVTEDAAPSMPNPFLPHPKPNEGKLPS